MGFDIEHFPTSESAKRMLSFVTKGFYDKSYVGKWLYQVMGLELDQPQIDVLLSSVTGVLRGDLFSHKPSFCLRPFGNGRVFGKLLLWMELRPVGADNIQYL